jgi:lipopolysaccharide/colanic/teichoic acid biosynthesis glycosyltransferase
MFSQHPFTLEHRYALDARAALPLWKRCVDLVCCAAGLPLLGLLTFGVTLVVKFASRGPVLYRQESSGHMGRRIRVYRFRTMRVASLGGIAPGSASHRADTAGGFIPGGRLLRATGLADLPQLVNVLRGEMSIVGPRPCLDSGNNGCASGPLNQVTAMPGLTGLWRIADGNPQTRDVANRWERNYAEHISFWSDAAIIARTVLAMFGVRRLR